jgi:hypothetical protein
MDNFLTTLYFELFNLRAKENKLMNNNTWSADESGHDANIRNDQSISETREFDKVLSRLIKNYLESIKCN